MAVVAPIMGGATAINLQPTGGGKAAITGDYALIGSEVPDVVRALRSNGIEVTAIHSHMLTEEPRIFFLHFWADDDALKLARGLRAGLDKTASASPFISPYHCMTRRFCEALCQGCGRHTQPWGVGGGEFLGLFPAAGGVEK